MVPGEWESSSKSTCKFTSPDEANKPTIWGNAWHRAGQGRAGLDSVCFLVGLLAFLVKNDICTWEYKSAFLPIAIAEHGSHAALVGIVFSSYSLPFFPLRNSEEKSKLVNIAFLLPCNDCICISPPSFLLFLVCAS